MKKQIINLTFFIVLLMQFVYAQSQNFNQQFIINNSFNQNTTLTPFNGSIVTGIGLSGNITFNSDTSFVRIIIDDGINEKYLVYETYPMLESQTIFSFTQECEESCFLDQYTPVSLILQVRDATIFIESIDWSNIVYSNPLDLQYQSKNSKNSEKVTAINEYIDENNLIWIAEETEFSQLYYSEKAKMWGNDYTSFGFEFYARGFYSMFGPERSQTMNHGYADNFDWRNRHNANLEESPYYDGDPDGSGWMTPAVCQGGGCWFNNQFLCNTSEAACDAMGGIYRNAPTCWAFGPTAQIEALTNLYYNEHIDIDLSEQYIVCEEGVINHGWFVSEALDHYVIEGVPDEECLHYSASLENCNDLCSNPQERIWIDDYSFHSSYQIDHVDVRQYLMEYGPVTAEFMAFPWGDLSHAMVLVGWDVIDEDELSVVGIINPANSDWYGHTYWIYKQSDGPDSHHNGFYYMIHWDGDQPGIYTIDPHITSLNKTDSDVNCNDKDGDGYYFWGNGLKPDYCPPCPDQSDGDDSDPGLGPINEYGSCTIINTYNASFENDWNNWVQVNDDDQDWWRHTGPTETANTGPENAQDGDFYIYTYSGCEGCYTRKDFTIESPPIDLSNFCEGQINFHYNQHTFLWGNPDYAKLEFQISYDGGINWIQDYWSVLHNQGTEWHNVTLNFPSTVNKVRFIARSGDGPYSDIALDNITIGPSTPVTTPITINTSTTWNVNADIDSDVIIEDGAILLISNCTISMHEQTSFIVKQGGQLTIDNATLNCQCDHSLWQGIQVWGDKYESQQPFSGASCFQGKLVLSDAVIENAIIGVDMWEPDNWSSTGGIVYADGTTFTNNAKSVHALHYRNFNPYFPEVEWDYYNGFNDCTFEITADYPDNITFYKHVDISHVNGFDFKGCDFTVAGEVEGVSQYNTGIAAYDAGFSILPRCTTTTVPCTPTDICSFTGFYSAINATSDLSTSYTFSVNLADFINNTYGVKAKQVNNASVLASNFYVGKNRSDDKLRCNEASGTGVYFEMATGFAIEENHFYKQEGSPADNFTGINITECPAQNEIYKNYFTGLSYANYSEGKNWYLNRTWEGLIYFCNENTNNFADFYVADKIGTGIQSEQGDENNTTGNKFSQTDATWHFYNGGDYKVDYYYCNTCPNETPTVLKLYEVDAWVQNPANTCPSHYGGGVHEIDLTEDEKLNAEQVYLSNLTDYNNVKTLYDNLIDGGNTEAEKLDIITAQPEDMWELRAQLLGDSPHLSMEVLIEVADRTDVFSDAALFDILAANPDELKKDTLLRYLENKENPLPDYMIDILSDVASGITYKTVLQQQMARYNRNKTRAAHDIIRSNLNDTVADYNELRNWLDNLGGITSDRQIITTYVQEGNFTNALTLANLLPELYELEGNDLTEHDYYIAMLNLYQSLQTQGRNTHQLNSAEISNIEIMVENSKGVAGAQAKSILEAVYGQHFTCCPELEGAVAYKSGKADVNNLNRIYGLDITVRPNPAKQWAAFDYTLPEGETEATITITNISGKTIDIIPVIGQKGQKLWDTRNFDSGVYLYTINAGGFNKSGKIVISK